MNLAGFFFFFFFSSLEFEFLGFGQLDTLQVELKRVREENRQLRSMLEQITKNYSDLHGQLILAMGEAARQKVNFF